MIVQLKLYGSSKILSNKDILDIQLPNNSNIKNLRGVLTEMIDAKHSKSNLKSLAKTAAFFNSTNNIINDNYKLKDDELISIIPPIGGG